MNFRQLTYFVAVAEEMHFGRAAERLDMAQPPLSRQIKQLEDDLGAILFNRGRSTITLTQAGERLYDRGRVILRQLEELKFEIGRLGAGAEGRLRIGFVGSATYGILPNVIKAFRAEWPDVMLSLIPLNNHLLRRTLIRREIDVAISRPSLKDAEFVSRKLQEEPLVLAVPETFAGGDGGWIALGEVQDRNFIQYPEFPRPTLADYIFELCKAKGYEIGKQSFTQDVHTALSLVAIGEGLSIVPRSVGAHARDGVRVLRIEPDLGTTELYVNYRVDEQGVHVHNFAKVATSVARKLD